MNNWKHWIANGLPVFVSTGSVSIKALLDSWFLDETSQEDLQAFALIFPLIILANTIAVSLSNGLTGTASKWIDMQKIQGKLVIGFYIVAFILGLGVALLLNFLLEPFILWFNAEKYRESLQTFFRASYLWLPFQFILTVQSLIARYIGLYKSSSLVLTICSLLGMLLSYYLLIKQPTIQPLFAIVLSNSAIAVCSSLIMLVQLFPSLSWRPRHGSFGTLREVVFQGSEIFYTTFLAQSFAVLFIFVVTRQFAHEGEDVVRLLAYLTRIEQLVLMLAFSFISVMLPDVARMLKKGDAVHDYIRQASIFLVICGVISVVVLLILLLTLVSITGSDDDRFCTLLLIAGLWFSGTVVQGAVVFFSQLLNVLLSPKMAVWLNILRFFLLGAPSIYIGSTIAGEIGIAFALMLLHFASWPIYYRKVNELLPEKCN